MTTEQEGAPSATAGGASAPDLDRVQRLAAEWGWMAGKAMARFVNSISGPIDGRLTDVATPDPRDAEIERLRGVVEKHRMWRDTALEHGGVLANRISKALGEDDWGSTNLAHVTFVGEQLNRLIDTLEVEVAQHDQTKAERDRLRQELDRVGEQPPKFQPGQRVRIGLCDGIVITPKDTTRVQFEGMLHTFDIPTRDVHAIDDIAPAEPRRWHAGDPEPEIGTTVWRRAERYRRSSNGWHRVGDLTGYGSWAWILSVGSEIVEAVDRG